MTKPTLISMGAGKRGGSTVSSMKAGGLKGYSGGN